MKHTEIIKPNHLLALLLAALLTVSLLTAVSCQTGGPGAETAAPFDSSDNRPADSSKVTENAAPETEPESPNELYADLPTGSYDGHEVHIIQYEDLGAQFTVNMDIEEDDGTLINGALWKRTTLVEDRLEVDVQLTVVGTTGEVSEKIEADIANGECYFDLFSNHSAHLATQTLNGQALSYESLSDVNLEKPWWDSRVMKNVAAGDGKIYMGFGYINMTCYDSQCVVWFNKDIAQTYQLGDVYQMIENDEWTMDNFITMCRAFGANGENLYGVGAYPYVGAPALIYGCGTSFFEYNDATSHYEYVGLTEKMMDVYNKMGAMLLDPNVGNLDWQTYRSSFRDGETFAMCSNVSGMKEFRNVELNYGLAPFPKYDAEQKEYLSYTTNQIQGVCVNVISPDLGLIGTVLENLAAESYRQLRSAYFEQLVNERLLRDDESKEILAMIYDSPLVLPIEAVYDFKMPGNVFNFDGGNANMASRLDAARQMINIALDEFYSWTNG